MIRVTADSNIYISGMQFAGPPQQFLKLANSGAFILSVSDAILDEVRQVLSLKFHWRNDILEEAMAQLARFTVRIHPTKEIDFIKTDPDDNRVLECAVESRSSYIVTGDNDLLRINEYSGIRIFESGGISAACTHAAGLSVGLTDPR